MGSISSNLKNTMDNSNELSRPQETLNSENTAKASLNRQTTGAVIATSYPNIELQASSSPTKTILTSNSLNLTSPSKQTVVGNSSMMANRSITRANSNNTNILPTTAENDVSDMKRPLVIDTGTPSYTTEHNTPVDSTMDMETKSLQPEQNEDTLTNTANETIQPLVKQYSNVQDDFFSLFTPFDPELEPVKKKKKKKVKVKKAKREESIESTSEPLEKAVEVKSKNEEMHESIRMDNPLDVNISALTDDDDPLVLLGGDDEELTILDDDEVKEMQQQVKSRSVGKRNMEQLDSVNVVQEFTNNKKRKSNAEDTVKAFKVPSFTDYKDSSFTNYNDDYVEEEEDDLLKKLKTNTANKFSQILTSTDLVTSNESTPSLDRTYILKITSHLPGTDGQRLDVKSKGSKTFNSISKKSLEYLVKLENLQDTYLKLHQPAQTVLLWKGSHQITPHMKPENLNIPENADGSDSIVELELYTIAQAQELNRIKEDQILKDRLMKEKAEETENFLSLLQKNQNDRERQKREQEEEDLLGEDDYKIINQVSASDEPSAAGNVINSTASVSPGKESTGSVDQGDYFKIVLKSQGNEKLIVQVNPQTKLSNLVTYFLKTKSLPLDSKIKFVFDDEDMDLTCVVGDTELEEDFAIDVHVG